MKILKITNLQWSQHKKRMLNISEKTNLQIFINHFLQQFCVVQSDLLLLQVILFFFVCVDNNMKLLKKIAKIKRC